MNKKYKRERKQERKAEQHKFTTEGAFDYNNILNGDINFTPSPAKKIIKTKHEIEKKQDQSKNILKGRNDIINESKTHQPKIFGRKDSSKQAYKSISDQLSDGIKKSYGYVRN